MISQHKVINMEKISPEEYRKILNGIDLKNILLSDLKATIKHELLSEDMKIGIKEDAQYSYEEDELIVKNKYVLTAKNKEKKTVLKIEGSFIVIFESQSEIDDNFFNIYKEISLPLNVWPFFRELVNSTTSRMNIPPLTLPLLKR
jgi:preprotein translocase subunit SecB